MHVFAGNISIRMSHKRMRGGAGISTVLAVFLVRNYFTLWKCLVAKYLKNYFPNELPFCSSLPSDTRTKWLDLEENLSWVKGICRCQKFWPNDKAIGKKFPSGNGIEESVDYRCMKD